MGHEVPRLPAASHHANSETLNVCSASLRTKSDNRRVWVFRQHCLGIPRRRLPIVCLRGLNVHCLTRRFVSLTFSLPSPIPSPHTATYLSSSSLHPPVISISSEFSSALRGFTTFASLRPTFPVSIPLVTRFSLRTSPQHHRHHHYPALSHLPANIFTCLPCTERQQATFYLLGFTFDSLLSQSLRLSRCLSPVMAAVRGESQVRTSFSSRLGQPLTRPSHIPFRLTD